MQRPFRPSFEDAKLKIAAKGLEFSIKFWHSSLFPESRQLHLCSALKKGETLQVFSLSANWPAGRAAGLQQPAAAAVNIKQDELWSPIHSVCNSTEIWKAEQKVELHSLAANWLMLEMFLVLSLLKVPRRSCLFILFAVLLALLLFLVFLGNHFAFTRCTCTLFPHLVC